MRRWRTAGLIVAVLLALPAGGRAEPPDDDKKVEVGPYWRSKSVWDSLFGSDAKPPPNAVPPNAAPPRAVPPVEPVRESRARKPAALRESGVVEDVAADRDREERAYLRRQAVCDKLREIAQQNKDEELECKVRQLDERIWAIYSQRTNGLPGSENGPDDDILDRNLGRGGARGMAPEAAARTLSGKDRGRQASVREERP